MNCSHAHQEITGILTRDVEASSQLQRHLECCPNCRHHWQEQAFEQWTSRMLQAPVQLVSQVVDSLSPNFKLIKY